MAGTTKMAVPAVVPVLSFRDGSEMVSWLCAAFGFAPAQVVAGDDGVVHHAELALGRAMVMGGSARDDGDYAAVAYGPGTAMLYVALEDEAAVDAHCERARAAGAEIVLGPASKEYGGRDYTARDPEGNLWTFGSYAPELPA